MTVLQMTALENDGTGKWRHQSVSNDRLRFQGEDFRLRLDLGLRNRIIVLFFHKTCLYMTSQTLHLLINYFSDGNPYFGAVIF